MFVYEALKRPSYLLLLTDCKGESESPKPAMVSEAICKELGIWSEERENCNDSGALKFLNDNIQRLIFTITDSFF